MCQTAVGHCAKHSSLKISQSLCASHRLVSIALDVRHVEVAAFGSSGKALEKMKRKEESLQERAAKPRDAKLYQSCFARLMCSSHSLTSPPVNDSLCQLETTYICVDGLPSMKTPDSSDTRTLGERYSNLSYHKRLSATVTSLGSGTAASSVDQPLLLLSEGRVVLTNGDLYPAF